MSVDRSTENDNGWGDLKSSETGHGKNDPWTERRDENKGKGAVPESSESRETQPCSKEDKESTARHVETNASEADALRQDRGEHASEMQEDRQTAPNKKEKDSGTSGASGREPADGGRQGGAHEEKGGRGVQHTREGWGDCAESRWGDASGSHGGAGEHKSWNDAERYATRGAEQGRRDFRHFRSRGYAEQDSWERRGPPRRQYEPREGGYEEHRRYESLDYLPRKKRFDDGNFAQGPSRFREGARVDLQRKPEWSGRDEMPHKEGWSGSRMSHDTREGFDSRGGWSRERTEGYARAPYDGFGAGDGWSRHRDGFASRGGANLSRESWSRPRQDAYGDVSGRDPRRGDTSAAGWSSYQSHGDFSRDGGYGGGRSEFKRYRQYSEGSKYHPYGHSGTPYEFRKKREIPVNPPPSKVIGLFGLSSHATLDDVKEFLAEKIPGIRYENVHLVRDGYTGQSRGFGFVYFSSLDEAITAKEQLQGQSIYNKVVRVDYSVSEGPRTTNIGNKESN